MHECASDVKVSLKACRVTHSQGQCTQCIAMRNACNAQWCSCFKINVRNALNACQCAMHVMHCAAHGALTMQCNTLDALTMQCNALDTLPMNECIDNAMQYI